MSKEKKPSIYVDRSTIGSADELDEYGVWVKSEPQDYSATFPPLQSEILDEEVPDRAPETETDAAEMDPSLNLDIPELEDLPEFGDFDIETDDDSEISDAEQDVEPESRDSDQDDDYVFDEAGETSDTADSPDPEDMGFTEISLDDTDEPADFSDFPVFSVDLKDDGPGDTLSDISGDSGDDEIPLDSLSAENEELIVAFDDAETETPETLDSGESSESMESSDSAESLASDESGDSVDPGAQAPAETGDRTEQLSTRLLMKIAEELTSIRMELANLKTDFAGLKAETAAETPDHEHRFFNEEDDEKIALTGDELNNILNTADFTEEIGTDATDSEIVLAAEEQTDSEKFSIDDLDGGLELDMNIAEDALGESEESVAELADEPETAADDLLASDEALDSVEFLDAPEHPASDEVSASDEVGDDDIAAFDELLAGDIGVAEEELPVDELVEEPETAADDLPASDEALDSVEFLDMPEPPASDEVLSSDEETGTIDFTEDDLSISLDEAEEDITVAEDIDIAEDIFNAEENPEEAEAIDLLATDDLELAEGLNLTDDLNLAENLNLPDFETEAGEELLVLTETGAKPMTWAPEPDESSYLEQDPLAMKGFGEIEDDVENETALDLSDAVIDEPDLSMEVQDNPVEEPSLESISLELEPEEEQLPSDDFESAADLLPEEELTIAEPDEIPEADEPEEITLDEEIEPEPEIAAEDTDEDLALIPEGFAVDTEGELPPAEPEEEAEIAEMFPEEEPEEPEEILAEELEDVLPEVPEEPGIIPQHLKHELKTVLSYMDKLLESLPDEKIEEFAKSDHFETYKKLFKELGLV